MDLDARMELDLGMDLGGRFDEGKGRHFSLPPLLFLSIDCSWNLEPELTLYNKPYASRAARWGLRTTPRS